MTGEKELTRLLAQMAPELVTGEYVFCTIADAGYGDHADLEPIATYKEKEGLTLVILRSVADEKFITYESVFRCITLNVHSSLTAIGLTASFSTKLAEHGISANVIAGYFHDYIFVQSEFSDKALTALKELTI